MQIDSARIIEGALRRLANGTALPAGQEEVLRRLGTVWIPQAGPQFKAFTVPPGWEIFYGGARGGGKTDLLLAMCGAHCLRYGAEARCLIVREEFKQTRELIQRGKQLYTPHGARWIGGDTSAFVWPSGARIYVGHCRTEDDAAKYQGWGVNLLAIEEIGNWANDKPLRMLLGALRSAHGIPVRWIATGNPGGRGHAWVKEEYITGAVPWVPRRVVDANGDPVEGWDGRQATRVFIPSRVEDNPKLLESDPGYIGRLKRQAGHLAHAWLYGDWDVAPGAYLERVWDPGRHVIDDFDPPFWWTRFIAIDWGIAAPYAVGWWCVRPDDGALILYRERYGYGGRANVGSGETATEVGEAIVRTNGRFERPDARWRPGVGDASMWAEQGIERGVSVASMFRKAGVRIRRGPQGGLSRVPTAHLVVDRLQAGTLLVTRSCRHWLRTVPVLAPDPDHPEDVDTEGEDHAWDMTRYAVWLWDSMRRGEKLPPPASRARHVPQPRIAGERKPAPIDPDTLRPVVDPLARARALMGDA